MEFYVVLVYFASQLSKLRTIDQNMPTQQWNGTTFLNQLKTAATAATKVLLINPPAYDVRLEWARWHQPLGLLQISSLLTASGYQVRLFDFLHSDRSKLTRQKLTSLTVDDYPFTRWHFGHPYTHFRTVTGRYTHEGWLPEIVLIGSLNSVWWEGVRDTVAQVRRLFPESFIVVGGAYPTFETAHSLKHSDADAVVLGSVVEATGQPSDWSLYDRPPLTRLTSLYTAKPERNRSVEKELRPHDEVVEEAKLMAAQGATELVIADDRLDPQDHDGICAVLDSLGKLQLRKLRPVLLGNMPPKMMSPRLAKALAAARVRQVFLHCDITFDCNGASYETTIEEYQDCVNLLLSHLVLKPRTGDLAAMLVVGFPGEDLGVVARHLVDLAHVVGSVSAVPFQYVPVLHRHLIPNTMAQTLDSFSLEQMNSKLFPLARLAGYHLDDYLDVLRLTALLNSKYRSVTFDFLGDNLTARLLRTSVSTQRWNPFRKLEADVAVSTDFDLTMHPTVHLPTHL